MSVSHMVSSAAVQRGEADALAALARAALAEGEEERVLPLLAAAAPDRSDARLWQWKALLERSLDEHSAAIESFAQAARLSPRDASIAHGRARVALEAGIDAVGLFEAARRLAPSDGDVLLGLAAARFAAGDGEAAAAELDAILRQAPLWIAGHVQLAQLRSMLGRPNEADSSLHRAIATTPHEHLWRALFDLHLRRENYEELSRSTGDAESSGLAPAMLAAYRAIAAAELGQGESADHLFSEADGGPDLAIWRIRHLLRSGRAELALPLIDERLVGPSAAEAWPYAAAAWRLTGDPRWSWLEGDERLVSVIDLSGDLPDLAALAERLRSLHVAKGQYLDQSVRGGTQTDGPLFSRIEPEIRSLRSAVVRAVRRHAAQLPAADPRHPTLALPRDRTVRFSGSWSVRLQGGGFHTNHVHPRGWISSALYVAIPDVQPGDPEHAGWLTLGEPQAALGLALPPLRTIKPKPGQLVLFPSWMWHGTVSFALGERLTVAFDVASPR